MSCLRPLSIRHGLFAVLLALAAAGCRSGESSSTPDPVDDPAPDPGAGGSDPQNYSVGGTVSGMTGTGLELSNNSSDVLVIDADGAFEFAALLGDGATYDVRVATEPANPDNLCTVMHGSGTIAGADVTDVEVLCTGPLELTRSVPQDGAAGVSRAVSPLLSFSADLDAASVAAATVSMASDSGEVDFALDVSGNEIVLEPRQKLLPLSNHHLQVTTDLLGAAGERMKDPVDIEFETGDGEWGADLAIDAASGAANDAQIVYDNNGNALALWYQEVSGATNLWANYYVADSGWGTAELVEHNDTDHYAGSPRAAFAGDGTALVVWTQTAGIDGGNVWSNRFAPATGWGTPVLVETEAGEVVGAVEMAGAPDGSAIAVWSQYDGQTLDIRANRYDPAAGWGTPQTVDQLAVRADYPEVSMDAAGNALVAWEQADAALRTQIHASRYTPSSGWEPPVLVSTGNTLHARGASLALDVDGNALLVFSQQENIDSHMHAARFTPSGGWEAPGRIGPVLPGRVEYAAVAFAADGSALAVWEQPVRTGGDVVMTGYANRYTPAGGWETPLAISSNNVFYPKVEFDAAGHALAVWYELDLMRPVADAYSVWGNRFIAESGWTGPARIGSYGSLIGTYMPGLAVAPDGDAMTVWTRGAEVRVNRFE